MQGKPGSSTPREHVRRVRPAFANRPGRQKTEPSRDEDALPPKCQNLAAADLASIVWKPWQDTWYMELNIDCLSRKLSAFSAGYSGSSYCRIAKLGLDKLSEVAEKLDWPSKVCVHVTEVGLSERVPGEEFVKLTVVERDHWLGEFVAARTLFLGCSRTIDFGLRRHH